MFIRFSVENYLSFKDLTVLDLLSGSITQHKNNVFEECDYKALKSIVIFGPNASGKSNLFKAIGFARNFILNSSKDTQSGEKIPVKSFSFSTETENKPSLFEFIFIHDNIKYRYGFRIDNNEIVDEWLFQAEKVKESLLFERHSQDIKRGLKFKEGKGLEGKTRKNALFLSVVAQFNGEIAQKVLTWFYKLNIISGLRDYNPITLKYLEKEDSKKEVMDIMNIADSTIKDFKLEENDTANIPKFIQDEINRAKESGFQLKIAPKVKTLHNKYNEQGEIIGLTEIDMQKSNSKGTNNLFSLVGPLLDTIKYNKILVIDELEANLHPLISRFLVNFFHKKNKSAQFIFNTHDTNLLDQELLRRDQIYFMDKNEFGESKLYSLYDFGTRSDKKIDKDYLQGRMGAIPFIDDFNFWDDENLKDEDFCG